MFRVGWIVDQSPYTGGAELAMQSLLEAAPNDTDVIIGVPGPQYIHSEIDVWVIGNCTHFIAEEIVPIIKGKPIVKRICDYWRVGDPVLKEWLLKHASLLICSSEQHKDDFCKSVAMDGLPFGEVKISVIPPPLDLAPFVRARAMQKGERHGTLWLGNPTDPVRKGITAALRWAERNGEIVDFYGVGAREMVAQWPTLAKGFDEVPYKHVPTLMASYKQFLFLPLKEEAFGRTIPEALAAGCDVITNTIPGSVSYIENNQLGLLDQGPELFWKAVREVVNSDVSVTR